MASHYHPDRVEKYEKIRAAAKAGADVGKTCSDIGVHKSGYYTWLKKQGSKQKRGRKSMKTKLVSIAETPADSSGKVFMFVGTPEMVAAAARGFL